MPLNKTMGLLDGVERFAPEIVTTVPASPELGDTPVTDGGAAIVRVMALLVWPSLVMVTGPVWAPAGIWVTTLVSLHEIADAVAPLNDTAPDVPKPDPEIVIVSPIAPINSDIPAMAGTGCVTLKLIELLPTPPAVT